MADIFALFSTNETLEQEGRWVPLDLETKFKIARSGNKHYTRMLSRLYNKNKVVLESKGDTAEAKSDEILVEVMAKTILLDWEGPVNLGAEKFTSYSVEAAKKLLAVKDFRRWVSAQSEDFEAFKAVQDSDTEKN